MRKVLTNRAAATRRPEGDLGVEGHIRHQVGRFGISTIRPTPLNTPLATTTLLRVVRVPDTPEVTIVPLSASLSLAADMAVAAQIASVISATSSAPVICPIMLPLAADSARVFLPSG